jgi:hypothetical protein
MDGDDLRNRFTYHPPQDGQAVVYETVRSHALLLALHLNDNCPDSREKSLAITHLEDCVFWANASIARHGLAQDQPPLKKLVK